MKLTWLALTVCAGLCAQGKSGLTARELFYGEETSAVNAKPPVVKPKPQPPARTPPRRPVPVPPVAGPEEPVAVAGGATPSGVPVISVAATATPKHLGVRYNVLQLVDREAKKREPVNPDTPFHAGDCVAIQLAPNRDGYLYVFNRGTTGAWQPLLPSPEMPGERNRVLNGKPMTVPSDHCFEFDTNAGTERMLVVITEKEEDARRLSEAMKQSGGEPAAGQERTMLAGGKLVRELEMLRQGQMVGRDIKIAKVGASRDDNEPANSVYAVRTSAGSNDRLVIEIALRHE